MRRTRFAHCRIALPVAGWFLAAVLLSGCASVTPGEMATGMASFVIVEVAEANAVETKTVALDQTPEEVIEILGKPGKEVRLGSKLMYVYDDIKVVFVDGKVTDVE